MTSRRAYLPTAPALLRHMCLLIIREKLHTLRLRFLSFLSITSFQLHSHPPSSTVPGETMHARNAQLFVPAGTLSPCLLGSRSLFVALVLAPLSPSNLGLFVVALFTTSILPRGLHILVLLLTSPLCTIRLVILTYLVSYLIPLYHSNMRTRQARIRELETPKIDRDDSSTTLFEWPTISSPVQVAPTSYQSRPHPNQPQRAGTKRKAEPQLTESLPSKRHEVIKLHSASRKSTLFDRLLDRMSFESTLLIDEVAQLASKSATSPRD